MSRSRHSRCVVLALLLLAVSRGFSRLSFLPAPDLERQLSVAPRRSLAVAATMFLTMMPFSPAGAAVKPGSPKSWSLKSDASSLDGYDFSGLDSKLGSRMDTTYSKVKPVCEGVEVMVEDGARVSMETDTKRYICSRADESAEKEKARKEQAPIQLSREEIAARIR